MCVCVPFYRSSVSAGGCFVLPCCFCAALASDSQAHMPSCRAVRRWAGDRLGFVRMPASERAPDELLRALALPSLSARVATLLECVLYAHSAGRNTGDGRECRSRQPARGASAALRLRPRCSALARAFHGLAMVQGRRLHCRRCPSLPRIALAGCGLAGGGGECAILAQPCNVQTPCLDQGERPGSPSAKDGRSVGNRRSIQPIRLM